MSLVQLLLLILVTQEKKTATVSLLPNLRGLKSEVFISEKMYRKILYKQCFAADGSAYNEYYRTSINNSVNCESKP